jgi:hypothetical protein
MSLLRSLLLALTIAVAPLSMVAGRVEAAPAEEAALSVALDVAAAQAVPVSFTDPRLSVYPLGTARVQLYAVNPTGESQAFFIQLLVLRPDGTIASSETSEVLSLAALAGVDMIFTIPRSDGGARVLLIPFSI